MVVLDAGVGGVVGWGGWGVVLCGVSVGRWSGERRIMVVVDEFVVGGESVVEG